MSPASLRSIAIGLVAASVALGFAYLAGSNSVEVAGLSAVLVCALVAVAVNWLAFVPAAITRSDRFYDSIGALTYLSAIAVACMAAWPLGLREITIAAMVGIWAIRLGSFLFNRIHSDGGTDQRFAKIKGNPPRFFVAWTLQAVWVIFTASAALIAITAADRHPVGVFYWVGAAIWAIGFAFEVTADEQKRRFKADPANDGRFIRSGLWAWSQHPNYFGEITLWSGILVMALPILSGWSFLAIISPVFVAFLLTRVSGINLLDTIAKKRWGDDPQYREYRRTTPKLIPTPPGK